MSHIFCLIAKKNQHVSCENKTRMYIVDLRWLNFAQLLQITASTEKEKETMLLDYIIQQCI